MNTIATAMMWRQKSAAISRGLNGRALPPASVPPGPQGSGARTWLRPPVGMNAGYLPRGLFAVVLGTDATDHRASISARAAIRIARSVPAETFLEVAKLELPSSLRRQ